MTSLALEPVNHCAMAITHAEQESGVALRGAIAYLEDLASGRGGFAEELDALHQAAGERPAPGNLPAHPLLPEQSTFPGLRMQELAEPELSPSAVAHDVRAESMSPPIEESALLGNCHGLTLGKVVGAAVGSHARDPMTDPGQSLSPSQTLEVCRE